MPLHAVAIAGSPRAPSKSRALAEAMLAALARDGCETRLVEVATLPADALLARASAPALDDAIAVVGAADIVVASSPTYRALYSGALKALFDLMPTGHLQGKVCVGILTAASPAHFLALEHGFCPLFASLDGVPGAGVYATDDEFAGGVPTPALAARVEQCAAAALRLAGGNSG